MFRTRVLLLELGPLDQKPVCEIVQNLSCERQVLHPGKALDEDNLDKLESQELKCCLGQDWGSSKKEGRRAGRAYSRQVSHHADGNTRPRAIADDLVEGRRLRKCGFEGVRRSRKLTTSGISLRTTKKQKNKERVVVKKDEIQGWRTSRLRGMLLILYYNIYVKNPNSTQGDPEGEIQSGQEAKKKEKMRRK